MNTRLLLALAGVVVLLIGVPLGVVALSGDDDEGPRQAGPAAQTVPIGEPDAGDPGAAQPDARGRDGGGKPDKAGGKGEGNGPPPEPRPRERANLEDVASPTRVASDGKAAARVVEAQLGVSTSPTEPTVIGASCEAGRCVVRYRSKPRGGGRNLEEQTAIVRKLFASKSTRSVTLYVHHQTVGRGHDERAAFMAVSCDRRKAPARIWRSLKSADLVRVCMARKVAGGRQRSLTRRELQSVEEASRASAAPDGRGASGKRRKAPSKVKGSYQAQNPGDGRGSDREPDIAPEEDPAKPEKDQPER